MSLNRAVSTTRDVLKTVEFKHKIPSYVLVGG